MNFKSDNVMPISPAIMQVLQEANYGSQPSYGADSYSVQLQKKFSEVFEKDVLVFMTYTGTAANGLALSSLVASSQSIYAFKDAHSYTSEFGSAELFSGGARIVPLEGANGKLEPRFIEQSIALSASFHAATSRPGCISITQLTESGTVYSLDEIAALREVAQKYDLPMHMDGARFTNALVALGCSPADVTWRSGMDVMSFGATKNGAMCAEAVVFFNHVYAQDFARRHQRAGQLVSKARFFASQFLAYFDNDLWLKNATHANALAQKMEYVFRTHNKELVYPVQANELFVKLSDSCAQYLQQRGVGFYPWGMPGSGLYRFVTSWYTSDADIAQLNACLKEETK